jgi:type VI secretion system protein ImpG
VRDELLAYYERELTFLRQMGAQFAEKYPKIASRLAVEADRCEDPHVERLLEAFAFLAARVHLKIDDEFPEITEALLNILYPHYLRPIPSMSVAEFQIDPEQNTPAEGLVVPKGAVLHSRPVDGLPLKFRTCYDVRLWPIALNTAQWTTPDRLQPSMKAVDSVAALRLVVHCTGATVFEQLQIRSLRFHLNGESNLIHGLYELLCNNCTQIIVRDPTPGSTARLISLDPSKLRPVGFGEDEGVIPYPRRSFLGYRLLQEYFSFPEKFFFLDIQSLDQLAAAGFKDVAEIIVFISPFQRRNRQQNLEVGVSERTFRLGCSPIVNLFSQTAEPILLSQTRYEYPIVPDVSHPASLEVFSVDEVVSVDPQLPEPTVFTPFYSHKYGAARNAKHTFWHAARRPSTRPNDDRSDVYISLVDLSGRPTVPDLEALTVRATCTNSDLPAHIPFGNDRGDLELQGVAPVKRIMILHKPSNTVRPALGKNAAWRLISHFSLNYLSLVDEGKDALQNLLRLYNFADSPHTEKQIQGISRLRSARRFARVVSEHGISFGRGTLVEMELDEDQFVGGGVYLFCSVLEHFFGMYVSMNSFCELTVRTIQRKEVLKHWRPRAGQRILV